jgi:palmitoyltransferase
MIFEKYWPWFVLNLSQFIASLICIFFTIMVGSLIFMHFYLATVNLTTWEFLSWDKISYLKVWPKKYGSPFTKGKLNNLKMYFMGSSRVQ